MSPPISSLCSRVTVACVIMLIGGCQSLRAERKTASMAGGLSAIQYQQVMDNLALIADQPGALPHFALTDSGKTLLQGLSQGSGALGWMLYGITGPLFNNTLLNNVSPAVQYQEQDLDQWDTAPALDPIQELVMHGLYLKALGEPIPDAEQVAMERLFSPLPPSPFDKEGVGMFMSKLQEVFARNQLPPELAWSLANYRPAYTQALRQIYEGVGCGWVHVGHHKDVPKNAYCVAKHGHTYVWVTKCDVEPLTSLTIAILTVATTDTAAMASKTAKATSPKAISSAAVLPPP